MCNLSKIIHNKPYCPKCETMLKTYLTDVDLVVDKEENVYYRCFRECPICGHEYYYCLDTVLETHKRLEIKNVTKYNNM